MRLFFATDIHGSETCWRKFLRSGDFYEADLLVLGGDMTGKAVVPIIRNGGSGHYVYLQGQRHDLETDDEVSRYEGVIRERGSYPVRFTQDELAELQSDPDRLDGLFRENVLRRVEEWVALADERLEKMPSVRAFVCPGNDDPAEVDEILASSKRLELGEGRVIGLDDGYELLSTGWSNPTPWKTYREEPEADMAARIDAMLANVTAPPERLVFNFHCPPHGTSLDQAAELDENLRVKDAGQTIAHVGSTAVREAIERVQPITSLHGHIHESRGTVRLGRTLSVNPGSSYEQGVLHGCLIDLKGKRKLKNYQLTTGSHERREMATLDVASEEGLFARKATGLVRGWSAFDGFIYAFMSMNLVALGLYTFSFAPFVPGGSLVWAIVLSTLFILFEVVVYAGMIAAIPRAGGDYIWQTRIIGGGVGFVLAATGWWFIIAHWVPIYGNILNIEILQPLLTLAGAQGAADWFNTKNGVFAASLIVIVFVAVYIGVGMRGYARFQKTCFWLGLLGLAIVAGLLAIHTKADFHSAFNREAASLYGATGDAYAQTEKAGAYDSKGLEFPFNATFLLIPFVIFWNLWANWGATLYGEVRGARDFKKNLIAMGGALVAVGLLALLLFALIGKTMGWDWYNAANNAYWGTVYGYVESAPVPAWPYPVLLASWLVDNTAFQFFLVGLLSVWFWGWTGTVFLSSTRVIFAAAFDRVLPEWASHVSQRGVPTGALALMIAPSLVVSALYAYWGNFAAYTLDATLVLAVSYLGTTIAAGLMPWRAKRIYEASPLARLKVGPIPMITLASAIFGGFILFNLILWMKDDVYGVNNKDSLVYMGLMYGLAIAMYVIARVVRSRQGIPLGRAQREIPVE
jgi:basic amino acid/polyamine antiporter, APA family